MGKKLDLSRLTDEEAKHVWEVVQRDFDLRKKEEERLEELKDKIEKENTKREFLTNQSHLNETLCIHCLQPFKFLLNSKYQCLDCHLYVCKSCSQYNKKEQGWMCDPCRLSRIVKTGSLEWYYEHIRTRFKHFGSAKVMRSLYGRMSRGQQMTPTLLGPRGRVYSLPDVTSGYHLYRNDESEEGETSDDIDGAEAEHYARSTEDFPNGEEASLQKDSMVAEADLAAAFHHILQEQGRHTSLPEQEFSTEVQFAGNPHTKNLERIPKAGSPWDVQSQLSAELDTSGENEKGAQENFIYLPQYTKRRSQASSQKNVDHSGNQPLAIESHIDHSAEEKELKRKLEELASNITEKAVSSDEENTGKKTEESKPEMSSSNDDLPPDAKKVSIPMENVCGLQKRLRDVDDQAHHSATTDSALSELEDKVASAVAEVQHTETKVSHIESRIAALSAAGLTVKPVERPKKKRSIRAFNLQTLRNAHNFLEDSTSPDTGSPDDFKVYKQKQVMSMPQVLRRKFNISHETASNAESFARNSYYRGSLTQRNPNGRNRKADHIFAKPVMTHWS
ncbi:melanophilin isoform X7 [Python bivittatus]|uniref:Melanophilin isoform X7 n=1 Tax=Python bivittatus TaxID=176946 RepID=A0A9F5IVI2_PYTBI|nr:melanophilin isoform X7 [Python bivittatus]